MARQSIIKRQNKGRRKTRFGIILDLLLPRHQNLLTKNDLLKPVSNDDIVLCNIFKIEDKMMDNQYVRKLYVDPHTGGVSDHVNLNRNLKKVNWNCAYCRKDIESQMDYFKPDNFVCDKCFDNYLRGAKMVPETILENSLAFTKHCKKLLKKDQKEFFNYLKRSLKNSETSNNS